MILEIISCNSPGLISILTSIKNILSIIQITIPILLIVYASIQFINLMKDPNEKNGLKKVINKFIATIIIILLPVIIDASMSLLGENTNISRCWLEANDSINITDTYYITNKNKKNNIILNAKDYERGEQKATLNDSNATTIPASVLAGSPSSNLSVVVADANGNILAQKDPDVLREGGSTAKVFTGLAAVKLLDPKNDIVIGRKFAQHMNSNETPDIKIGQKLSVSQAATRDFPGSSNITACNIAITIGEKYYSTSSEEDAYLKGLDKINEFLQRIGCTKTKLVSASGVNLNWRTQKFGEFDNNGISKGTYGETARDLALVTILAMNDENFAKGINGRNNNGLFFIKSGTQAYKHGIWGFNYKGKRYYIAILGFNFNADGDKRETVSKSIYNWTIKNVIK